MSVATIVVAALLLTYINLLFGEILPKRIAMSRTEEDSFKMVGILFFFAKILHHLQYCSVFLLVCFYGL